MKTLVARLVVISVFLLAMLLYSVQRFIEEAIRIDNPRDVFGLTASQAISVAIFVISIIGFIVLRKLPVRSPRAVPCKAALEKMKKREEQIASA